MRHGCILFILLLMGASEGVLAQGAPPTDTLRLELTEAIIRALDSSPEIAASASQREFAEARSRFAQANRYFTDVTVTTLHTVAPGLVRPNPGVPTDELYLDPDVRNDWDHLRPFNRFEFELRQPIWTWGELGGNIRAAQRAVGVEAAGVRETEAEVALRTAELYQALLLATSIRRLTGEAEDVLATAQRELQRLLDEGAADVDDADLFRLQITEQEFLSRVTEVEEQYQTARTAIRRQLMLPDGAVVEPSAALTPLALPSDSLDIYFMLAEGNRPELQQAESGIAAREALVDVAESDYYPKFFLAATGVLGIAEGRHRQPNPFVGDPFRSRTLGAALGFRQNLNFAQTRARVEQARAELNEVQHQQIAARQLVAFEVEEAFRRVTIAGVRLQARERSLSIAREWLRTEQVNFDLDLGNPQNLIDAVQSQMELEAAYLESVRAYNTAVLRLMNAAGVLVNRARSNRLAE